MVDDVAYCKFVEKSSNNTMEFIIKFVKATRMDIIYKERARLLLKKFKERITAPKENCPLIPHVLDMESSPAFVWSKCLANVPSAYDNFDCVRCGSYTDEVSAVWIKDQKFICKNGYNSLLKYLQDQPLMYEVSCRLCHLPCNLRRVYNHHIFVELELRASMAAPLLKCKLSDFKMQSEFSAGNKKYR